MKMDIEQILSDLCLQLPELCQCEKKLRHYFPAVQPNHLLYLPWYYLEFHPFSIGDRCR